MHARNLLVPKTSCVSNAENAVGRVQNPQRLQARELLTRQTKELDRSQKNLDALDKKTDDIKAKLDGTLADVAKLEKALQKAALSSDKGAR